MNLPEPTIDYVNGRLHELDGDSRFYGAERTVQLVFQQWPSNKAFESVLVKTIVLNRLYNTSILDVWTVAQHIVDSQIDDRLRDRDPSLVHEIASVEIRGKARFNLSFATKYCSWHEPEGYQIYDSYVDRALWTYKKQFSFASFQRQELREYFRFVEIVDRFKSRFGLGSIGRKQLDKFLWIEGRTSSTPDLSTDGSPRVFSLA